MLAFDWLYRNSLFIPSLDRMNTDLTHLHSYPFEKLAQLKSGATPPADRSAIFLSIGEPKQATPAFIRETIHKHLGDLSKYPATKGTPELRQVMARWLERRFQLAAVDPETQVLPVNGTREALFAFAQAVVDRSSDESPTVLMPNPFYQIYEGAALLAGAQPRYLSARAETGWVPDFHAVSDAEWRACQLLYVCSPGNPTGAVIPLETLQWLIHKAREHHFIIASDECYSELYADENAPPPGLLQAAASLGDPEFRNCVVFNSLSKRSSAPGLRSGLVAGDAAVLRDFLRYRTYHGCAMSLPYQAASAAAWADEPHVREAREAYRQKFAVAREILSPRWDCAQPAGGFYWWVKTPVDDETFTRELFRRENVTVLPGSYLSRVHDGMNPGHGYVRIALVAPVEECAEAARRIRREWDRYSGLA